MIATADEVRRARKSPLISVYALFVLERMIRYSDWGYLRDIVV